MQKREADQLLMALDGVMAYLETIRTLVKNSVESQVPEVEEVLTNADPELCGHPDAVEVQTLGELNMVCHACGKVWAC